MKPSRPNRQWMSFLARTNRFLIPCLTIPFFVSASASAIGDEARAVVRLPVVKSAGGPFPMRMGEAIADFQKVHIRPLDKSWKPIDGARVEEADSLYQVTYSQKKVGPKLVVEYRLPYLDVLQAEGIVRGVEFIGKAPFRLTAPNLAILINNPTNHPMIVSEVAAEVRSSSLDQTPIIVFQEVETAREFVIHNLGWKETRVEELAFGVAPLSEYDNEAIFKQGFRFQLTKPFPLATEKAIDIGNESAKAFNGQERFLCFGQVKYRVDEKVKTIRFMVRVKTTPPGIGAYATASANYDMEFKAGKSGYTQRLGVTQFVKPLEADRFDLRVISDKSAKYSLKLTFNGAGELIGSQDVEINIFRPRLVNSMAVNPNYHARVPLSATLMQTIPSIVAVTINPLKNNEYLVFVAASERQYVSFSREQQEMLDVTLQKALLEIARQAGHAKYQFYVIDRDGNQYPYNREFEYSTGAKQ